MVPSTLFPDGISIASGVGGKVLTGYQVATALVGAWSEAGKPMPYGKFAQKTSDDDKKGAEVAMVPSRQGMTIIYGPAFVISFVFSTIIPFVWNEYAVTIAGIMCCLTFLKRSLEVQFLHKYSGPMEDAAAKAISFVYSMYATIICILSSQSPSTTNVAIGVALFTIGTAGNFYHHYLLANLRKEATSGYVAPHGGLFDYVAAPHYLFEIMAWAGMAVASQHINVYLILFSMTGYLSGRSMGQNKWNREKFSEKEWPASRKSLVPFIF